MKTIHIIYAVIFVSFVSIMLLKQVSRKKQLYKSGLSARVISFEKGNKGYYHIVLLEKGKLRYIDVVYANGLRLSVGDSLYKDKNSNIFKIKKDTMRAFSRLDLIDAHIGKKWE